MKPAIILHLGARACIIPSAYRLRYVPIYTVLERVWVEKATAVDDVWAVVARMV